ncbi:MAG: J domain-containing protein [Leptolyngbyaceae cyanobacterium bins.302]|nr:J domain-containing protein [Leptolyngbyaceae cyanobacterium bins.302]
MSFQIERGLFVYDFIDQHAILGVPVDADTQTIRKRYLKIARRLHPDSCASESEVDKQRASEFLSKLVNPAWEKLSQEKERVDYDVTLKMIATKRAKQAELSLGNLGKELLTASNPDHFYRASLKSLGEKQFEHLDQSLDIIGQISELNMVYLIRKEGQPISTKAPNKAIYTGSNIPDSSQSSVRPPATRTAPPQQRESVTDQYCRRAEGYAAKNNFAQAVLELRDALQMDPKNSKCHALLGSIYLRQNQATMARIHFGKALESDPNNEMALQGQQRLEAQKAGGAGGKTTSTSQTTKSNGKAPAQKPASKPKPNDQSGGGLFGLFGGKKK